MPAGVCNICGTTDHEPTPFTNVMGTGANLVRCWRCGLKFYDVWKTTPEHINNGEAAHRQVEASAHFGGMNNRDESEIARFHEVHRNYYNGMIDRLALLLPTMATLYEVGASYGEFLLLAAERGLDVRGCEPNLRGCELARASGLDVAHGFFQDVGVRAGLDAVVMLDVIEHTTTPREDLEKIFAILRPGGVMLLKTFFDEWHIGQDLKIGAGDWEDPAHGYFDPFGHLYHFDVPVLLALIARVGFTIHDVSRDTAGCVTVYAGKGY